MTVRLRAEVTMPSASRIHRPGDVFPVDDDHVAAWQKHIDAGWVSIVDDDRPVQPELSNEPDDGGESDPDAT